MPANDITKNDARNIRVVPFLEAYEKQESLWNPTLESYKNKNARDEAYNNIIKELNSPRLTINDIKLKVKSIRTTYTKELRILTKYKEEGKQYLPKLFWFNRAHSFLKDVSLSRDRRTLAEKTHGDTPTANRVICHYLDDITPPRSLGVKNDGVDKYGDDNEMTDTSHQQSQSQQNTILNTSDNVTTDVTTTAPATINNCNDSNNSFQFEPLRYTNLELHDENDERSVVGHDETMSMVKNRSDTLHSEESKICCPANNAGTVTSNNRDNDEYDQFCRSVAVQLRHITDSYSRAVAKLKIQQILFEAETGHYRNNPTITIPVSQPLSNL